MEIRFQNGKRNPIAFGTSLISKQEKIKIEVKSGKQSKEVKFICKKGDRLLILARCVYNYKEGTFLIVKKDGKDYGFILDSSEIKEDEILNEDFKLC